MSKILIGIIVAMSLGGYIYYNFTVVPMINKLEEQSKVILAQDLRDQEQKAAITAITENFEKTSKALQGQQVQNEIYQGQMTEYLDVFRRHNLGKLASARPGLVEKRINNGTKEVFNAIQNDSVRISTLND